MRQAGSAYRDLTATAARRYAPAGRFATRFALGKLRHDPVFAAILAQGLVPDRARLVDLGCGQGVLFALLVAAIDAFGRGAWPVGWPPPPRPESMEGFDIGQHAIAVARTALGARARLVRADPRTVEIPACEAIAMIDVLHYIDGPAQEAALAKCAAALSAGGILLLRVADAEAGWRFPLTRIVDQLAKLARDRSWPRLHCRPLADWIRLLEQAGFEVRSQPASDGMPFANSLLVARRR